MLKKSLIISSISVAFFLQAQDVSTIYNTVDVYSNGTLQSSAKSNAMAGSTGALGGDGTALFNNPAGLGVAIAGNMSGTLLVGNYKNTSKLNGASIDYSKTIGDANINGIMAYQLLTETPWKFVNIGFNYTSQNLDNYVETPGNSNIVIQKNLLDSSNNPVVGNLDYLAHAYNRTGTISKMALGVGANYDNKLYLGLGINLHGAELEQSDTAAFGLDLDNSVTNYSKQYTPFSESSSGFSANIGVIGKINNMLRVGAAIESPTFWNLQRVYTDYYQDSAGYISSDIFTEDRTLTTPMKAILSASLVPNKNFAINVDYTLGLTKAKYKNQGPAEVELNDFFSGSSKNMSDIKVGAEYRVKALRLRAGYGYTSNPFDTISFSAYNDAGTAGMASSSNLFLGSKNTLGLGLGYDWKSFFIDAAYQNVNSKYDNPFLAGYSANGTGYYSGDFDVNSSASAVSKVESNRNNFSLTLGWKF